MTHRQIDRRSRYDESVTRLGVLVSLAAPAVAALKVGEKAPDFSANASLAGRNSNFL